MWDFFSVFILIIVVIVVVAGLVWWVSSGKGDKPYRSTRNESGNYRDEPPLIKRAAVESYIGPSRPTAVPSNVMDELSSFQLRLSSLERQVQELAKIVRGWDGSSREFRTRSGPESYETSYAAPSREAFERSSQTIDDVDFLDAAKESYRRLSVDGLRNLSLEPVFVFLDVDESARGSAIGEAQRIFKQSDNKQNAFIIFPKGDEDGWLFPNPRISYTESMRYVFPNLSYENFTESKHRVEPTKVQRTAEGVWETFVKQVT